MNIGEGGGTIAQVLYEQSASQSNIDYGDELFASLWCSAPYDVSAPGTCDNYSGGNSAGVWNLKDADLSIYKWPGFFFGIGAAHRWPAVRLGGAAAADTRTYTVSCVLPTAIYSTAAKQRVTLKAPSGATVETVSTCSSPTMDVTVDRRVAAGGTYLRLVEYLTSGDAVIAGGEWQTMGVQ